MNFAGPTNKSEQESHQLSRESNADNKNIGSNIPVQALPTG